MMGRSFIAGRLAVPAAIWLIISLILVSPALAEAPLENPGTAQPAFSGVALLSYYSGALDFVLEKSPHEVEDRLEKMPFANIPPSLDAATEVFTSSTTEVAHQVVYVGEGVDNLTALVAQSRFDEAGELITELTGVVAQAKSRLAQMEQAIEANGQVFRVDAMPADSDLKMAYDEVLDKIERIRQMLALDVDIINNLSRAIPGGGPGGGSGSGFLYATELTLQIDPQTAFVGDSISFRGILTKDNGEALVAREVDILLNGSPYASATTGAGGLYEGSLQVPYWYVPQITVQALYYPRDSDVGVYMASLSPEVMLQVMFCEATLDLTVAREAYPGLETWIAGRFDYGSCLIASERRVEIYLDNDLVASLQARPHVSREIAIPPETEPGQHVITVSAQATGRYAAVVATAGLTVTRMTPAVDLETPRLVLVPWSAHFSGTVRTASGPLDAASIKTSLRDSETQLASSDDGTFDAAVRMGWGFDLFGTGQLQVKVTPREPWIEPVTVTRSVFLVNVVNCSGLLIILIFLGIYVPGRLRGRLGRRPSGAGVPGPQPVEPAPVYSAESASAGQTGESPAEPGGKLRDRILRWYLLVLTVVQRITRVAPRPDQTLREFTLETESALGPLARRFAETTTMVEKVLYSRHEPSEEDAERARSLSQNLEKGPGGEAE